MSMYGDGTAKQELWEAIQAVQSANGWNWIKIVRLLAEIIADIVNYQIEEE